VKGGVERERERERERDVIAQVVGWENPDPNHNMVTTKRTPTHCHLR
jgi:hypothetical protein